MKSLATKCFDTVKYAIRSHIFQREVLIIISVITLLFIGVLRDNKLFIAAIYGRVIITQIDRLPKTQHVNSLFRSQI